MKGLKKNFKRIIYLLLLIVVLFNTIGGTAQKVFATIAQRNIYCKNLWDGICRQSRSKYFQNQSGGRRNTQANRYAVLVKPHSA